MTKEFLQSPEEVHSVIADAERHRKFVWTAGRILKEAALWAQVDGLEFEERKAVLKRVTGFLEVLAVKGILQRRQELQSIGYGNEIGFDYVRPQ